MKLTSRSIKDDLKLARNQKNIKKRFIELINEMSGSVIFFIHSYSIRFIFETSVFLLFKFKATP